MSCELCGNIVAKSERIYLPVSTDDTSIIGLSFCEITICKECLGEHNTKLISYDRKSLKYSSITQYLTSIKRTNKLRKLLWEEEKAQ